MSVEIIDDCSEMVLKKLCCTCLSRNRKLVQLCRVKDGVNNLYLLLSADPDAYREGFYKDMASLFICWECEAIMKKISIYRQQACSAQKNLTAIVDGHTNIKLNTQCLSNLSTKLYTSYEIIISKSTDILTENAYNFIDCGPAGDIKVEQDVDDIPLAELQNISEAEEFHMGDDDKTLLTSAETHDLESTLESTIKRSNRRLKTQKIKRKKLLLKGNKKYITTKEINEQELIDYKQKQKLVTSYMTTAKCESCCEEFTDYIELEKHTANFHSGKVSSGVKTRKRNLADQPTPFGYKCSDCDKYFDKKNLRYKHIRRYHREGYSCTVCGKRYPFKDNLIKHERLHQGPLPREECHTCHKMIRVDLVKTHARIHTKRESYSCLACNKKYISRASYENHLKYSQAHATGDVLKYKCSMCDKGYRSKGELRDHINYQHLGKTQHQCPVCGKALATRRCITRHVRRAHHHHKESARDKICQQCGKAFRDKKGLREHEFIHTGERPLACEICGCTFRQNASLYTHRKRVHKIYPQKKSIELVKTG